MSTLVYSPSRGVWRPAPASAATRSAALSCEVARADVDAGLVEATERVVRMASRSLGIDPPRVRWLPKAVSDCRGVVFSENLGEVWIRLQPPDAASNSALHETRHVYQLTADRWVHLGLHTMEQRQRDADRFARDWRPFEEMKSATGERLAHKTSTLPIEIKADTSGSFEGYVSTWTVDSVNERFVPGAWTASLKKRDRRPLLWHHDMSQVVGVEKSLVEDRTGLKGRWAFADTAAGQDMRKLVTSGAVTAMSVGFIPQQTRPVAGGITEITEADILESSLVSLACNEAAVITSAKSMPHRSDILAELRQRRQASRVPAASAGGRR